MATPIYYYNNRSIVDPVELCEHLLFTDEGSADREQAHWWFTSKFEPGPIIEIAEKTDKNTE